MRFRPADAIGPEHVGRRVTVRRRLPDGTASDLLGTLESCDEGTVSVRRRDGALVRVARNEIVAARVVRE